MKKSEIKVLPKHFDKYIFLLGCIGVFTACTYTYILRKVEITEIASLSMTLPIIYFVIDKIFLKNNISTIDKQ